MAIATITIAGRCPHAANDPLADSYLAVDSVFPQCPFQIHHRLAYDFTETGEPVPFLHHPEITRITDGQLDDVDRRIRFDGERPFP